MTTSIPLYRLRREFSNPSYRYGLLSFTVKDETVRFRVSPLNAQIILSSFLCDEPCARMTTDGLVEESGGFDPDAELYTSNSTFIGTANSLRIISTLFNSGERNDQDPEQ